MLARVPRLLVLGGLLACLLAGCGERNAPAATVDQRVNLLCANAAPALTSIRADQRRVLAGFSRGTVSREKTLEHLHADFAQLGALTTELSRDISRLAVAASDRARLAPVVRAYRELGTLAGAAAQAISAKDLEQFKARQARAIAASKALSRASKAALGTSSCGLGA
jgi:hypothetical protein